MCADSLMVFCGCTADALVLRSGFARTILQARQTVLHRHILVDGKDDRYMLQIFMFDAGMNSRIGAAGATPGPAGPAC